jgi:hypothetical protein
LFEDKAEFGLRFRVALDRPKQFTEELVQKLADQSDEAEIYEQGEVEIEFGPRASSFRRALVGIVGRRRIGTSAETGWLQF